ncbi:hypothetical protein P3S48_22820, partial [Enterobacter hormaechei]|uniref:hypothetical protein n=1 Tax=Enterobacter hormaechei TaxID=158836 RepID=UPI0023E3EBC9
GSQTILSPFCLRTIKAIQITVWHKLTKESGERARNLLRGSEALAGCRGAAMTGLLSITPGRVRC